LIGAAYGNASGRLDLIFGVSLQKRVMHAAINVNCHPEIQAAIFSIETFRSLNAHHPEEIGAS
jgi:hypothetical protein